MIKFVSTAIHLRGDSFSKKNFEPCNPIYDVPKNEHLPPQPVGVFRERAAPRQWLGR